MSESREMRGKSLPYSDASNSSHPCSQVKWTHVFDVKGLA